MGVKRVYVEKKPEFAVQAKELRHEVKSYLGIKTVKNVRVLIRYDVENLSDSTFERACNGVFAEPPVDVLYREDFPHEESDHIFSVEFLPGQFDQRADSAAYMISKGTLKFHSMPILSNCWICSFVSGMQSFAFPVYFLRCRLIQLPSFIPSFVA